MNNLKRIVSILFMSLTVILFHFNEVKAMTLNGENTNIKNISEAVEFAEIVNNIDSNSEVIGNKKIIYNKETAELKQKLILKEPDGLTLIQREEREISKKEYKNLCKIVEAEATGEDLIGKILVANVILNRYDTGKYDSITDVIFAKNQFSPISDGRFYSVEVTDETKKAVDLALDGADYSSGALFFMNRKHSDSKNIKWFDNNLEYLFTYSGHEFFK